MHKNAFILLLVIFAIHQFIQKILEVNMPFVDGYLDDIICIPIILQLWNWEKQYLLDDSNYSIHLIESLLLTILLSLLFEYVFPWLSPAFTFDLYDFIAYALGWCLYLILNNSKVNGLRL